MDYRQSQKGGIYNVVERVGYLERHPSKSKLCVLGLKDWELDGENMQGSPLTSTEFSLLRWFPLKCFIVQMSTIDKNFTLDNNGMMALGKNMTTYLKMGQGCTCTGPWTGRMVKELPQIRDDIFAITSRIHCDMNGAKMDPCTVFTWTFTSLASMAIPLKPITVLS